MSAFSEYVAGLADPSRPLSIAELRRLSGLDRQRASELASVWLALPTERRRQVVSALNEIAEDNVELDFIAALRVCLADPDAEVRAAAVEGLWEDEETSTALRLLEMLAADPSARVREAAAAGLAPFVYRVEVGSLARSTAERLRAGLIAAIGRSGEEIDVRRRALEAIAYLSTPETWRLIEEAYGDDDARMRASAVFAMGRNCDAAWLDTVIRELGSRDAEMRYEAARAAGELEDERAVRPLVPLLADADREVRLAAIAALGAIGGATARRALEYTARHGDDEAKDAAVEALEELEFDESPLGLQPRIVDEKLN